MINLSSMFAKSPFKPLRDHMDKVVESVAIFHVMGYYTASRGPLVNFLLLLFSRSVSITRISRGRIK